MTPLLWRGGWNVYVFLSAATSETVVNPKSGEILRPNPGLRMTPFGWAADARSSRPELSF